MLCLREEFHHVGNRNDEKMNVLLVLSQRHPWWWLIIVFPSVLVFPSLLAAFTISSECCCCCQSALDIYMLAYLAIAEGTFYKTS